MIDNTNQFIGEIPENYDRLLGPIIFEDYANDLAMRAASLKPNRVLELAAGTGIVSRKLRDSLPANAHLTITDLNTSMLVVAKEKFNKTERVDFFPANAMQLDFADDEFDLVVCQFGVMFFPDKVASLKEVRRVLQPNGSYLLNAWNSIEDNPFAATAHEVSSRFFTSDPPVFYQVPFSYPDPETVLADMTRAGFDEVEFETIALQKKVKDWRHFSRGLVYGNPLIDEINSQGDLDANKIVQAIETSLRTKFGMEPAIMPLKASVFCGKVE